MKLMLANAALRIPWVGYCLENLNYIVIFPSNGFLGPVTLTPADSGVSGDWDSFPLAPPVSSRQDGRHAPLPDRASYSFYLQPS